MAKHRRFVVAIHELDRIYGGPEEGGWWFDCGVPARERELAKYCRVFRSEAKAKRYARRLREGVIARLNDQAPKSLGSLTYDGGIFGAFVQKGEQPRHWPRFRPRYG